MEVKDHTFLVSGGSSGLGAACARMVVAGGGSVVIADLNREHGDRLAGELGGRARFAACDVTDEVSVTKAVDTAVQAFGALHGSIQCAGIVLAEKVLGKSAPHSLATF